MVPRRQGRPPFRLAGRRRTRGQGRRRELGEGVVDEPPAGVGWGIRDGRAAGRCFPRGFALRLGRGGGRSPRRRFTAGMLGALGTGQRIDHHADAATDHARGLDGLPVGGHLLNEFGHDLLAQLLVAHFPAAKPQGELNLDVVAEEVHGLVQLDAKIVGVNDRPELDFLHPVRVLVFPGLFFLLGLLVLVLAEVHNAADRRIGVGRHLDQVHAQVAGPQNGLGQRQDAQLFALGVNDADLAGADFAVDANRGTGRTAGRERAAQNALLRGRLFMPTQGAVV